MSSTTTELVITQKNPDVSDATNHLNTDSTVGKPVSAGSEKTAVASAGSDKPGDAKGGNNEIDADNSESTNSGDNDSRETSPEIELPSRPVLDSSYVGWKQIGGWEERDRLTQNDLLFDLSRETALERFLPEIAYGDWYHSTALFFVSGFLSFAVGYFKFSLGPVFFIMVATALLYRTSIRTYRRSIRDLVQKELTVEKIEDDYETMDWMNNFLDKFWPTMEPALSQLVVKQVNDQLATNPSVPAFISALWIDQFTVGIKPPRVDMVKTFQNTERDVAVMDWAMSFTPKDLSDLDAKKLKNYINQKIVLKAKLFGVTIPVVVQDISFKAHVRVRMKMMTPFPHVETVNVQLLEVPDFDFVFKIFGDSVFNWELMSIPGLLPLIKEMLVKYAGPILLPPFSFQLNVPQLLSDSALSIGVVEFKVHNAKRLIGVLSSPDEIINPYLEFSFNGSVIARTKTIENSLEPCWDESLLLLLGSFTDPLSIKLCSKRQGLKDRVLGRIQYNLSSLHDKSSQNGLTAKILNNSKKIGELNFDLNFHPTLEPKKCPDGSIEDLPDLNTGITKIEVEEARSLPTIDKKEKPTTYVEVHLNAKLLFTTGKIKNTIAPKYKTGKETVISDRRKTRIKFIVKDDKDEIIASSVQSLNDLIDRTHVDKKWIPLPGAKGELKITTVWKPVRLGNVSEKASYIPPIGVVRVFINKAENLRNLEKFGKVDPYARVLVNGTSRGRTNAVDSKLDPIWNEAIYVSVTSPNQKITIECMDAVTVSKDRSLGKFNIKSTDLFQKGPDDKYLEIIDNEPKFGRLVSKKGAKGTVTYYLSFYPTLPVLSLEEIYELDGINANKKSLEEKKASPEFKSFTADQKKEFEAQELENKELSDMLSNKLKLDLGELLQYGSGVVSLTVLGGELPQTGCYVQAFFDSSGHAKYVSPKCATKTVNGGSYGDCFIKELQWSVTTFRVTKNPTQNKAENALCEFEIPTFELIRNCYYKPSIVTMTGSSVGRIMVQASWFPVLASKLPQADVITNTGDLTIDVISANRLIAADKNGKSDPYVEFYIDDSADPCYKTKTQKKTLDPVWNESTTIPIYNRVNNYLKVRVMDWDAGTSDDLIGLAIVPLANIDPDSPETPMQLPLTGPDGSDGGILSLNFKFEPKYTVSVKKVETSVGDLANKGLSAGLHAGTSVIGGGLGAMGKLKKGILGGGSKKKDKTDEGTE